MKNCNIVLVFSNYLGQQSIQSTTTVHMILHKGYVSSAVIPAYIETVRVHDFPTQDRPLSMRTAYTTRTTVIPRMSTPVSLNNVGKIFYLFGNTSQR